MPRAFVPRMHVGKIPMKFYFRATDIFVTMPEVDIAGKLVLVWKRGPRRTTTEPFVVKETLSSVDGSLSRTASTSQDLALICTMFKNARAAPSSPSRPPSRCARRRRKARSASSAPRRSI